jgi:uncharacterized membrane protein YjdF
MGAYIALRLIESEPGPAFENARRAIDFEQSLGLYFEPDLQRLVLESDLITRAFNWVYSFGFLAVTAAALLWLWFVDDRAYRILRNSIGISAALAIVTIAVFPTAPPRLLAESGLVDSVVVFGREHSYANEYAAIPSLHVGWMAAVGFALAVSIGGRRGAMIGVLPGAIMMATVIVTGNHFWIDGVIGSIYALGAAWLLSSERFAVLAAEMAVGLKRVALAPVRATGQLGRTLAENPRAQFTTLSLGGLLAYLLVAQIHNPGFTDFWGYLVGQVAVILIILVGGEAIFSREGGLSWITHGIAVFCCFADVLGTDGDLYARIDEYDKLTHFAGVAALTAAAYDFLRLFYLRLGRETNLAPRIVAAIAIGFGLGIAWEVYEVVGDKVFGTARVGGTWDTANDLVSDALGAVVIAALLLWGELNERMAFPRIISRDSRRRSHDDRTFGLNDPEGGASA